MSTSAGHTGEHKCGGHVASTSAGHTGVECIENNERGICTVRVPACVRNLKDACGIRHMDMDLESNLNTHRGTRVPDLLLEPASPYSILASPNFFLHSMLAPPHLCSHCILSVLHAYAPTPLSARRYNTCMYRKLSEQDASGQQEDDEKLLRALWAAGHEEMEQVPWNTIVEGWSGMQVGSAGGVGVKEVQGRAGVACRWEVWEVLKCGDWGEVQRATRRWAVQEVWEV